MRTTMTELHSFKDDKSGCFANIRMDNGDPCWIGVAQAGVAVKKSRIGLLGAKLYMEERMWEAANTAKALAFLYPEALTPSGMKNPVLTAFTNAVLQCSTVAEATRVLNTAVKEADRRASQADGA